MLRIGDEVRYWNDGRPKETKVFREQPKLCFEWDHVEVLRVEDPRPPKPAEKEYVAYGVAVLATGMYGAVIGHPVFLEPVSRELCSIMSMPGFDAIEYLKDGALTWWTLMDSAFGEPQRVRFRKA